MNAAKNKIKSQRGASITFALLLFLVCAVISSVVIVAATAAAGRMSEQADMDERYYAVTAVANRLYEVFDGKEVKVTYDINAGVPDIDSATVSYADGTLTGVPTILTKASKDVVQGIVLKDIESVLNPTQIQYKNDTEEVTCSVDRIMKEDGRLEYTISAQVEKPNGQKSGYYTVVVTISPNLPTSATEISPVKGEVVVKWKLLEAKKIRAV